MIVPNEKVYTPVLEAMKQSAVKAFLTGGAGWFLDDKIYKLPDFKDLAQNFDRYLIKSSTFTVAVTRFVEQRSEKAVASKPRFTQNLSPDIPLKKEITTPLPLTGCLHESSETFKTTRKIKSKVTILHIATLSPHSVQNAVQASTQTTTKST